MRNKENVISYLSGLSNNESNKITKKKLCRALDLDLVEVELILNELLLMNFLRVQYSIKCDNCGLLVKVVDSNSLKEGSSDYICYSCENEIVISNDRLEEDENIEEIYNRTDYFESIIKGGINNDNCRITK